MKAAVVALLFAASAFAHAQSAGLPAACGVDKVTFNVTGDEARHAAVQLVPGKARVYFVQDDGILGSGDDYNRWSGIQHNTIKIGMDGTWLGAYKNNSYFALDVEPGEHHICAKVQSHFSVGSLVALAHFTAEAGKIYFFRTRFLGGLSQKDSGPPYLDLDPIDSDQGKYLIASFPWSVWKGNK
jgi:hypothetical protein